MSPLSICGYTPFFSSPFSEGDRNPPPLSVAPTPSVFIFPLEVLRFTSEVIPLDMEEYISLL